MSAIKRLVGAARAYVKLADDGNRTWHDDSRLDELRRSFLNAARAVPDREELREELRSVAETARPDVHPLDCAVIARAVVEHLLGGVDA